MTVARGYLLSGKSKRVYDYLMLHSHSEESKFVVILNICNVLIFMVM